MLRGHDGWRSGARRSDSGSVGRSTSCAGGTHSTTAAAIAYRERILAALPAGAPPFEPLMTLYLTDSTTAAELRAAKESGVVHAVKLYPAGATTNSASGVTDYAKVAAPLAAMGQYGLPLCVHGEVTDPSVDVFDRE